MNDVQSLIYKGRVPDLVCCECLLRKIDDNEWITFIQTGGPIEPHPDNNVFICRSYDHGMNWTAPEKIFKIPGKAYYQTEAIVTNEKIVLFICTHSGYFLDWKEWYCESFDNGHTFGELKPLPIEYLNKRTFIRNFYKKNDGTWILPVQHYNMDENEEEEMMKNPESKISQSKTIYPENGILLSKDNGATWKHYGKILTKSKKYSWAELNVVELEDDYLVILIRVDLSGCLYRSDSFNGGMTWSEAVPTDIPNPGTKFRLFKFKNGNIALLHNPFNQDDVRPYTRNPISIWVSDDNMKSWCYKRDLITFPGNHSYPDGFVDEKKGYIHFAYDYNKHDALYYGVDIKEML